MGLFNEETDRSRCTDWIAGEIARGRSVDSITEDLIDKGWSLDDAEEMFAAVRETAGRRGGVPSLFKSISRLWKVKDGGRRR